MNNIDKDLEMFKLEDRVLFDGAAVVEIQEAADTANNPDPNAQQSESDREAKEDRETIKNAGPVDSPAAAQDEAGQSVVDGSIADVDAAAAALINGDVSALTDYFSAPVMTRVTIDPSSQASLSSLADDSLVIVDSTLPGSESLLASAESQGRDVLVLDEDDGLDDVLAYLQGADKEYGSIHFFSHANKAGVIKLGADVITDDNIQAADWREIGTYLADDGDIMFYGCELGESGAGRTVARQIAELTDADVAVSDDVTGVHGDWELEYQIGDVNHEVFVPDSYDYDLAATKTITVNLATDDTSGTYDFIDKDVTLREAIEIVNRDFYGTEHRLVNNTLGTDDDGSLKYYDAKVEGDILTIYDESGAATHQFTLNTAGDAYVDASDNFIAANTLKTDADGNVTSAFVAKDATGAKVADYDFKTNADYAATYEVKFSIGKATEVTLDASLSVTDTQWGLTVTGSDKITVIGSWEFTDATDTVFSKGIYTSSDATFTIVSGATVTTDSVTFDGATLQVANAGNFVVIGEASVFRNGEQAIDNQASGTVVFAGTTKLSGFTERAIANVGTVRFEGNTTFVGNTDGAITNAGTLDFADTNETTFANNTSLAGGAIYTTTDLATNGSVAFTGNDAKVGGAIYAYGATVTVNDGTVFAGNHAEQGGAIYLGSGEVRVNGGEFSGNYATGDVAADFANAQGGAIYVTADQDLTITGGTFDSNFTGHYLDVRKAFGTNDVDADHARLNLIDWSAFGDKENVVAYIDAIDVKEASGFREIYAADGSFLGFAIGETLYSATLNKDSQVTAFTDGTCKFKVTWGKDEAGNPIVTKVVESVTKTTYDSTTPEGIDFLSVLNKGMAAMSYQAIVGFDVAASGKGGAVYAAADSTMGSGDAAHALAVSGATFTGNRAEDGGAVYADSRDVTVGSGAVFDSNVATKLNVTSTDHAASVNQHFALDGQSVWTHATFVAGADGMTSELVNYDFSGNLLYLEATYEHEVAGETVVEKFTVEGDAASGYALSADSKGYKLVMHQEADGSWDVRVTKGTFGKDGYWEAALQTAGYQSPDQGLAGAVFAHSHTVTVTGATFKGNVAADQGGAIYVTSDNRTVKISYSSFAANEAGAEGGAVYFKEDLNSETGVPYGNMTLAITNSDFSGNISGSNGGALYLISTTHADVIGSTFDGNAAAGDGGAILIDGASVYFTRDNAFTGNHADGNGGALEILDGSVVSITDAEFADNSAAYGGAIHFAVTSDSITLTVADATFTGNAAELRGGAVFGRLGSGEAMEKSLFSFTNDVFNGNRAASGGAMAFVNEQSEVPFLITVEGTVFEGNRGYLEGGALAIDPNVRMVVKDSSFSDNFVDATGVDADALARAALAGTMVQGMLTAGLDNVVSYVYGGGAVVNRGDFTATNIAFTGNSVVGKTNYYTYDQNWFGRYETDAATGALVLTEVEATDCTESTKVFDASGTEVTSGAAYEAIVSAWAQLFNTGTDGIVKTVRTSDTKIDGYDAAGNKVLSLTYSKKDGKWTASAGKAEGFTYYDADGTSQKASVKIEVVYGDPVAKTGVQGVKYTVAFKYKDADGTAQTYSLEKTLENTALESRAAEQLLLRGTNGETAIKATVEGKASYVTFDQASGNIFVGDSVVGTLQLVDGAWMFTLTDKSLFGKVNEAYLNKATLSKTADNGGIEYLNATAAEKTGTITLKYLDGSAFVSFNLADLTKDAADVANVKILTFRTEGTGGAIMTIADDNANAPAYDAETKIVSSTFFDNAAEFGGAIYQGSRFHTAQFDHGTAVGAEGEYLTADGKTGDAINLFTTVVDSTIAGNTSTDAEGYAYQQMSGESKMINDIIVGNQRGTAGGNYDLQVKVSYLDEANSVKVYEFYRGGELVWLVDDNSLPTEATDWTRTFEALWTGAGLDQIDNGVGDIYAADYGNYHMLYTVFGEVGGDLSAHLDAYVTISTETTDGQTIFELLTRADGEGVWFNDGIVNAANVQVSAKEVERAIWTSVFKNLLTVKDGDKSRVDYSASEADRNVNDTWTENGSWIADTLQKETYKSDLANFKAWIGTVDSKGTLAYALANNGVLSALGFSSDLITELTSYIAGLEDGIVSGNETSQDLADTIATLLQYRDYQALTTEQVDTLKGIKAAACWTDLQSRVDTLDATAGDVLLANLGLIVQDGDGLWTTKGADYKIADYTGAFAKFASTVKDDGKTVSAKIAKALHNVQQYKTDLGLSTSESDALELANKQIIAESMSACFAAAPLTDTDVSVTVDMSHVFTADTALEYVFGQTKSEIAGSTGGEYITIESAESWSAERVTNWTGVDHVVVDGVADDAPAYADMTVAAKYEALWNAMSDTMREAAVKSAFDLQNEHAYADMDAWEADTDYATKTAVLEKFLANVKLNEADGTFTLAVASTKAIKATDAVSLYMSSSTQSYAGVPSVDGLALKDNFDFTSTYMSETQQEMFLANYNAQLKNSAKVLATWTDALSDADFKAYTAKQFLAKGATLTATFQKFYDKVESGTEKDGLGFSKVSTAVNDLPKAEVVEISPVAYYQAAYIQLASEADGSLVGVNWARPVSNDDAANCGTRLADGGSVTRQHPSDAVYNNFWGQTGGADLSTDQIGTAWDYDYNQNRGAYWINAEDNSARYALVVTQATDTSVASFGDVDMTDGLNLRELVWLVDNGYAEANLDMDGDGVYEAYEITFASELFGAGNTIALTVNDVITWGSGGENGDAAEATNRSGSFNLTIDGGANRNVTIQAEGGTDEYGFLWTDNTDLVYNLRLNHLTVSGFNDSAVKIEGGEKVTAKSGEGAYQEKLYSTLTIENVNFYDNTAKENGGAVNLNQGSIYVLGTDSAFDRTSEAADVRDRDWTPDYGIDAKVTYTLTDGSYKNGETVLAEGTVIIDDETGVSYAYTMTGEDQYQFLNSLTMTGGEEGIVSFDKEAAKEIFAEGYVCTFTEIGGEETNEYTLTRVKVPGSAETILRWMRDDGGLSVEYTGTDTAKALYTYDAATNAWTAIGAKAALKLDGEQATQIVMANGATYKISATDAKSLTSEITPEESIAISYHYDGSAWHEVNSGTELDLTTVTSVIGGTTFENGKISVTTAFDGVATAFRDNVAANGKGGAIYVGEGKVVLGQADGLDSGHTAYQSYADISFAYNTATKDGGAIYVKQATDTEAVDSENAYHLDLYDAGLYLSGYGEIEFTHNAAGHDGGAAYVDGAVSSEGDNTVTSGAGNVRSAANGTVDLSLEANAAKRQGGALFAANSIDMAVNELSVERNSVGGTDEVKGGAMYANNDITLTLTGDAKTANIDGNVALGKTSAKGGALYAGDDVKVGTDVAGSMYLVRDNRAETSAVTLQTVQGGAIWAQDVMVRNLATVTGNAVSAVASDGSVVTMKVEGGVLYAKNSADVAMVDSGTTAYWQGNRADATAHAAAGNSNVHISGGAVYSDGSVRVTDMYAKDSAATFTDEGDHDFTLHTTSSLFIVQVLGGAISGGDVSIVRSEFADSDATVTINNLESVQIYYLVAQGGAVSATKTLELKHTVNEANNNAPGEGFKDNSVAFDASNVGSFSADTIRISGGAVNADKVIGNDDDLGLYDVRFRDNSVSNTIIASEAGGVTINQLSVTGGALNVQFGNGTDPLVLTDVAFLNSRISNTVLATSNGHVAHCNASPDESGIYLLGWTSPDEANLVIETASIVEGGAFWYGGTNELHLNSVVVGNGTVEYADGTTYDSGNGIVSRLAATHDVTLSSFTVAGGGIWAGVAAKTSLNGVAFDGNTVDSTITADSDSHLSGNGCEDGDAGTGDPKTDNGNIAITTLTVEGGAYVGSNATIEEFVLIENSALNSRVAGYEIKGGSQFVQAAAMRVYGDLAVKNIAETTPAKIQDNFVYFGVQANLLSAVTLQSEGGQVLADTISDFSDITVQNTQAHDAERATITIDVVGGLWGFGSIYVRGGGVAARTGTAKLTNATLLDNGIRMTLKDSGTVQLNTIEISGGQLYAKGDLTLVNTTIKTNVGEPTVEVYTQETDEKGDLSKISIKGGLINTVKIHGAGAATDGKLTVHGATLVEGNRAQFDLLSKHGSLSDDTEDLRINTIDAKGGGLYAAGSASFAATDDGTPTVNANELDLRFENHANKNTGTFVVGQIDVQGGGVYAGRDVDVNGLVVTENVLQATFLSSTGMTTITDDGTFDPNAAPAASMDTGFSEVTHTTDDDGNDIFTVSEDREFAFDGQGATSMMVNGNNSTIWICTSGEYTYYWADGDKIKSETRKVTPGTVMCTYHQLEEDDTPGYDVTTPYMAQVGNHGELKNVSGKFVIKTDDGTIDYNGQDLNLDNPDDSTITITLEFTKDGTGTYNDGAKVTYRELNDSSCPEKEWMPEAGKIVLVDGVRYAITKETINGKDLWYLCPVVDSETGSVTATASPKSLINSFFGTEANGETLTVTHGDGSTTVYDTTKDGRWFNSGTSEYADANLQAGDVVVRSNLTSKVLVQEVLDTGKVKYDNISTEYDFQDLESTGTAGKYTLDKSYKLIENLEGSTKVVYVDIDASGDHSAADVKYAGQDLDASVDKVIYWSEGLVKGRLLENPDTTSIKDSTFFVDNDGDGVYTAGVDTDYNGQDLVEEDDLEFTFQVESAESRKVPDPSISTGDSYNAGVRIVYTDPILDKEFVVKPVDGSMTYDTLQNATGVVKQYGCNDDGSEAWYLCPIAEFSEETEEPIAEYSDTDGVYHMLYTKIGFGSTAGSVTVKHWNGDSSTMETTEYKYWAADKDGKNHWYKTQTAIYDESDPSMIIGYMYSGALDEEIKEGDTITAANKAGKRYYYAGEESGLLGKTAKYADIAVDYAYQDLTKIIATDADGNNCSYSETKFKEKVASGEITDQGEYDKEQVKLQSGDYTDVYTKYVKDADGNYRYNIQRSYDLIESTEDADGDGYKDKYIKVEGYELGDDNLPVFYSDSNTLYSGQNLHDQATEMEIGETTVAYARNAIWGGEMVSVVADADGVWHLGSADGQVYAGENQFEDDGVCTGTIIYRKTTGGDWFYIDEDGAEQTYTIDEDQVYVPDENTMIMSVDEVVHTITVGADSEDTELYGKYIWEKETTAELDTSKQYVCDDDGKTIVSYSVTDAAWMAGDEALADRYETGETFKLVDYAEEDDSVTIAASYSTRVDGTIARMVVENDISVEGAGIYAGQQILATAATVDANAVQFRIRSDSSGSTTMRTASGTDAKAATHADALLEVKNVKIRGGGMFAGTSITLKGEGENEIDGNALYSEVSATSDHATVKVEVDGAIDKTTYKEERPKDPDDPSAGTTTWVYSKSTGIDALGSADAITTVSGNYDVMGGGLYTASGSKNAIVLPKYTTVSNNTITGDIYASTQDVFVSVSAKSTVSTFAAVHDRILYIIHPTTYQGQLLGEWESFGAISQPAHMIYGYNKKVRNPDDDNDKTHYYDDDDGVTVGKGIGVSVYAHADAKNQVTGEMRVEGAAYNNGINKTGSEEVVNYGAILLDNAATANITATTKDATVHAAPTNQVNIKISTTDAWAGLLNGWATAIGFTDGEDFLYSTGAYWENVSVSSIATAQADNSGVNVKVAKAVVSDLVTVNDRALSGTEESFSAGNVGKDTRDHLVTACTYQGTDVNYIQTFWCKMIGEASKVFTLNAFTYFFYWAGVQNTFASNEGVQANVDVVNGEYTINRNIAENTANPEKDSSGEEIEYNQDTGKKHNRTRIYFLPAFFLGMPCPHFTFSIPPIPVPGVHTAPMVAAGNLAVLTKSILYTHFEKHSDFNLNYLYHTDSGVLVEASTDAAIAYDSDEFRSEVKGDVASLAAALDTTRTNTDADESWLPYTVDGTADELYGTVIYVGEDFSNGRDLNARDVALTAAEKEDANAIYVTNLSGKADGLVEGSLAWAILQAAANPSLTVKFADNLFVNNALTIELLGTVALPTNLKMDGGKDADGNNRTVTISTKEAGMFFDTGSNGGTTSDWLESKEGTVVGKGEYSLFSTTAAPTNLQLTNVTLLGGAPAEDGGVISALGDLTLTATNALFERGNASGNGGAISVKGVAELMLINSQIVANNAAGNGGAIKVAKSLELTGDNATLAHNETETGNGGAMQVAGNVTLKSKAEPGSETEGIKILDNEAGSGTSGAVAKTGIGGALYTDGSLVFGSSVNTDDIVRFQGNTADENAGAIRTQQAELYVSENVSFIDNAAYGVNDAATDTHQGEGGAIWMADGNAAELVVDGALFEGNEAAKDGGAIYLETVNTHSLKVKDGAEFVNNAAISGEGGAIRFLSEDTRKEIDKPGEDDAGNYRQTEVSVENSVFEGNFAGTDGGAIATTYGCLTVKGAEMNFTDNTALGNGGAIDNDYGNLTVGAGVAFDGNAAAEDGGALCVTGALAEIDGAEFKDNQAGAAGGAVATTNMKSVFVRDSLFSGNRATDGGAIGAEATDRLFSQDNLFNSNYASSNGGALDAVASTVVSDGDTFASNLASGNGGAVSNRDSEITVTDGAFLQNTARENGGAVATTGDASTTIEDSEFTANRAGTIGKYTETGTGWAYNYRDNTAATGSGGAVANLASEAETTIEDSAFAGNVAARDGGAVYAAAGTVSVTETDENASDFTDNVAGVNGGAIAATGSGEISVTSETEDGLSFADNAAGVIATTYAWVATEPVMSDLNANYGTMNRVSKTGTGSNPAKKVNVALTSYQNGRTGDTYNGVAVRSLADGAGGGAISVADDGASVTVGNIQSISGNTAYSSENGSGASVASDGGAVLAKDGAEMTLEHVQDVSGNAASGNGGFLAVTDDAEVTVDDINAGNNSADKFGGQISVDDASLELSHSSLQSGNARNEGNVLAVVNGGETLVYATTLADFNGNGNPSAAAVYAAGAGSEADLVNATVTDNQGAGVKIADGATAQLVNDIVLGNGTGKNIEVDATSKINLDYSITDEQSVTDLDPANLMDYGTTKEVQKVDANDEPLYLDNLTGLETTEKKDANGDPNMPIMLTVVDKAGEGNITNVEPEDVFVTIDADGDPVPATVTDSTSGIEKFVYPIRSGSVADTKGTDDPASYLLNFTGAAGDGKDAVGKDFSKDIGSVQETSPEPEPVPEVVVPGLNEWQQAYYYNLNLSSRSMYEAELPLSLESRSAMLTRVNFTADPSPVESGFRVAAETALLATSGIGLDDSSANFLDADDASGIRGLVEFATQTTGAAGAPIGALTRVAALQSDFDSALEELLRK